MSKKFESTEQEIAFYLKSINSRLSIKMTIVRGFFQGVAQLVGATIGITIFFFILARFFQILDKIPVVNLLNKNDIVQIVREEVDTDNEQQESN